MGGPILHPVRLCQRPQTDKTVARGQRRHRALISSRELVPAQFPAVFAGLGGHGDQLVFVPTGRVQDGEYVGCVLVVRDDSGAEYFVGDGGRGFAGCDTHDVEI